MLLEYRALLGDERHELQGDRQTPFERVLRPEKAYSFEQIGRPKMPDDKEIEVETIKDFRLKEFESLRKEIDDRRKDQWVTERDVVVATVAIYWALANADKIVAPLKGIIPLLWFSPLFIWLAGISRWMDDGRLITEIGRFIRWRECQLDPGQKGWEHFHVRGASRSVTFALRALSWAFLLVLNIVVPFYIIYTRRNP
jgi:hypothetical protein